MVNIEPILTERWATYQRWIAAGEPYSALVKLAEMGNILDHQDVTIRLSRNGSGRLLRSKFPTQCVVRRLPKR
jgi:hypothetical protein